MSLDPEYEAELFSRHRGSIKPGLSRTEALLSALGHPERDFRSVHIAGTNGKGSVAHAVAAISSAHDVRTGMFTSPHLRRLNERFTIDGREISDHQLEGLFVEVVDVADRLETEQGLTITFFEISTAVAFLYFSREKVRLAVVETGLGGRLDSTNVLSPLVSVITSVAMDHEAYLGSTIEAIASEKAGIIKADVPVVTGALVAEADMVCRRIATEKGAPYIDARDGVHVELPARGESFSAQTTSFVYRGLHIEVGGAAHISNLSVSLISSEIVLNQLGIHIKPARTVAAISGCKPPGRFQCVRRDPDLRCDVAHNPEAFEVLKNSVLRVYGDRPVHAVVGMCVDKGLEACMEILSGFASSVELVSIRNERSATPAMLANAFRGDVFVGNSTPEALDAAICRARIDEGVVLVCGSVFLVGEVFDLLDRS